MFERVYRQRLDADLARWQSDGIITPTAGAAIRGALPPLAPAINIATVVAILGGLLIAAAFLAFIAANWTDIARPARFAILLAGIVGAYGTGAIFAYSKREVLSDMAVCVGSVVFGAAIALVGQMYHLGGDFAGGIMLWAIGALVAAAATGSRGALAVALATGCVWSGMRMEELQSPHLPFVVFWLIAAGLATIWNSGVARHLVGAAALAWWIATQIDALDHGSGDSIPAAFAAGATLLLGAGLALTNLRSEALRLLGQTLSNYGAFGLPIACTIAAFMADPSNRTVFRTEVWISACGVAGVVLAFAGAATARCGGQAFAGLAGGLALLVGSGLAQPAVGSEPWLAYALLLGAMLCLVISGMLDEARPRIVAGWIGLAATIAGVTWGVQGSLLRRAVFLAIAGLVAVGLALALGRLMPKERTS